MKSLLPEGVCASSRVAIRHFDKKSLHHFCYRFLYKVTHLRCVDFKKCCVRGVLHPNLKLACFVSYLQIINTFFWKIMYNASQSKLSKELKNGFEILQGQAVFKLWNKMAKTLFWSKLMTLPCFAIFTKLSTVCVCHSIHTNHIPGQLFGTLTLLPQILSSAVWLCLKDLSIPMPLHFGIISQRKSSSACLCHPLR